ncbi:glycosyltransferase [Parasphingopyxis algicola]|uniref:glycosyltransferase n=1 Tax=Parasphingopyxis algicola TaxID=2026624 RepID=UPI0015A4195F|nr:glycosyltransferase [Parasphingopyxis algicola]QLC26990.1 glycosyltransferase [Parasphingopyxis algicola]
MQKPALSIVVIFHEMRREAERTLFTLSPAYQRNVGPDDYEVIAIDNGSRKPLDAGFVTGFGRNFRHILFETGSPSPAAAVNRGIDTARGELVAVIVDGARMVSPGLVAATIGAAATRPDPFALTLAWHLGPDVQNVSMLDGYDQDTEDALLASIDWRGAGYALFDIATLAPSSRCGFRGGMPSECSWFAMRRDSYRRLGGFDERFQSPGGGLVNQDFLHRILAAPGIQPIVILGEGSFHQFHGGVATNVPMAEHPMPEFRAEYARIRGREFAPPRLPAPDYFGRIPARARRFLSDGPGRQ